MKKTVLSNSIIGLMLLSAWVCWSPVLASEDYQNELRLFHSKIKEDGGDKTSQTGLAFRGYFVPVTTQGIPLDEAAFLDRAGNVSIVYSDNKFDGSFELTTDLWGINATLAKQSIPWMLSLSYFNEDGKTTDPINIDVTSETFDLGVGYFVEDGLLIVGQYEQTDTKISSAFTDNDLERTTYGVGVKWLHLLSAQTALNLEANVERIRNKNASKTDDGQNISISGDYYFTPEASAGLWYSKLTHDDKSREGSLLGITAKYFVKPQFSVGVDVGWFDAESAGDENDERWSLSLAYRF